MIPAEAFPAVVWRWWRFGSETRREWGAYDDGRLCVRKRTGDGTINAGVNGDETCRPGARGGLSREKRKKHDGSSTHPAATL